MNNPFPGMDPYLEHPILWEGVHARLINSLADQLQPRLDPRYVTSIEERVFIEDLEVRESRIEILDAYNEMRLVTLIELLSPTNKAAGPGRESYLQKQRETLERDCHLLEIDLLRRGRRILSVPEWKLGELGVFDSIVCVNRWTARQRFEVYPRRLRQRLPRIQVPLAEPDADVVLDVQAALEDVYLKGRYGKRIRYHEPCEPSLSPEEQQWANERWSTYRSEHPELGKIV